MKIEKLNITLGNTERSISVYHPGEDLIGTIRFTIFQRVAFKRVQVSLKGYSKVEWFVYSSWLTVKEN